MEQTSMGKDSSKTAIAKFVPDDDGVLKHTIKVHQQPTSATEKKGPSTIARSNDLIEEIQIKRRFGNFLKTKIQYVFFRGYFVILAIS